MNRLACPYARLCSSGRGYLPLGCWGVVCSPHPKPFADSISSLCLCPLTALSVTRAVREDKGSLLTTAPCPLEQRGSDGMGMGRLAVKHHCVLVVNKGSLGQCNEKSVGMQFILKSTKRWLWLGRKRLCVCVHEHSQPRVTAGLEQDGPCRVCSQGSGEGLAQHCALGLGNPQQCFSPSSCLFLWNTFLFAIPTLPCTRPTYRFGQS